MDLNSPEFYTIAFVVAMALVAVGYNCCRKR